MEKPELVNMTIAQLLRKTAAEYKDRTALFSEDRYLTYGELDALTDRIASGFVRDGLARGDIAGLFCNTSLEGLVFFYALLKAGARVLLFPEKIHEEKLGNYFRCKDQKAIVCDSSHYEQFGDRNEVNRFPYRYLTEEVSREGWKGLADLTAEEPLVEYPDGDPFDTEVMLFTSGSTGDPKIVCTSGYSRVNGGIQQAYDQRMTCEDIVCEALPIHHCFALSVNVIASLASGAALYIPPDRHTKTIYDALRRHRCTVLSAVPTLYNALITKQDVENGEICLREGIIGGGRYTPDQFKMIDQSFGEGFTLISSLGMTEGTAGVTVCEINDDIGVRSTTVGHFMNQVEGKIADPETGVELPCGQKGEIVFRGYNVMQGYYQNPEETAKAIDAAGFLHSGDLGWLDEKGYLHMAGRIKELIIRGGENISPAEIENALLSDRRIRDCLAVGIPDEHWGEVVCACVVAEGLSEQEIQKIAAEKLERSKVPSFVVFMDAIPVNANNKVDAKKCRMIALEKLGIKVD